MRKSILVLILLMTYSAHAQVISGSIVIFSFTKDKLVVAADSLANNEYFGTPDYSHCKIAAFNHQLIFTSVGATGFVASGTGVQLWDNKDLARDAIHTTPRGEHGDINIDAIVETWAKAVKSHWDSVDQEQTRKTAAANGGQLTAGVFIGKELIPKIAIVRFNSVSLLDPVEYVFGNAMSDCWPCAELQGNKICAAGKHLDVVAKFCSQRRPEAKILIRTPLLGDTRDAELPVKIVELTIDGYEKTAGDVGGKVDAATINKNGSITWNSRKKECPENQD